MILLGAWLWLRPQNARVVAPRPLSLAAARTVPVSRSSSCLKAAPWVWSVLIGIGMSAFSLALTVIALRARNAEDTAQLSGMAQGFGYLFAGLGPFLFGLRHDVSEGWTIPFAMFLVVYVVQVAAGAAAGRSHYV